MTTATHRAMVPADVVGQFVRGTDPVQGTVRADYWRVGDWRAVIRSGAGTRTDMPGYSWDVHYGLDASPWTWSGTGATRAACEWEIWDLLFELALAGGDGGPVPTVEV